MSKNSKIIAFLGIFSFLQYGSALNLNHPKCRNINPQYLETLSVHDEVEFDKGSEAGYIAGRQAGIQAKRNGAADVFDTAYSFYSSAEEAGKSWYGVSRSGDYELPYKKGYYLGYYNGYGDGYHSNQSSGTITKWIEDLKNWLAAWM